MLKSHTRKLEAKIASLREKGEKYDGAKSSLESVNERNHTLIRRLASEKDRRMDVEKQLKESGERVSALSRHIEKLMVHLKHEAAAKTKAAHNQTQGDKEIDALKKRNVVLAKKNKAKERTIVELQEGSRILEDQLRLMDEKFIELRNKLDWTRASSEKEVRRIQKEANRLKTKFALAGGADSSLYSELEAFDASFSSSTSNSSKTRQRGDKAAAKDQRVAVRHAPHPVAHTI